MKILIPNSNFALTIVYLTIVSFGNPIVKCNILMILFFFEFQTIPNTMYSFEFVFNQKIPIAYLSLFKFLSAILIYVNILIPNQYSFLILGLRNRFVLSFFFKYSS